VEHLSEPDESDQVEVPPSKRESARSNNVALPWAHADDVAEDLRVHFIDRYSQPVYRLCAVLLELEGRRPPGTDAIIDDVVTALRSALVRSNLLTDEVALRNEVYRAVVEVRRSSRRHSFLRTRERIHDMPSTAPASPVWANLMKLPRLERLALLLQVIGDLKVMDLAAILRISERRVEKLLGAANRSLQTREQGFPLAEIKRAAAAQWSLPNHARAAILQRVGPASESVDASYKRQRQYARVRAGLILAAAALGAISLVLISSRMQAGGGQELYLATPVAPPSVSASVPERELAGRAASQPIPNMMPENLFLQEPSLSGDGRYLTFTTGIDGLVSNDMNGTGDVLRLDLQTNILELVSLSSGGVPGYDWSYAPSISSDGRWVAFSSYATTFYAVPGEGDASNNLNVYLRDMARGTTSQISLAADGGQPNSHSFNPSISANGRWIVYWSLADDLLLEDEEQCGPEESPYSCLDIFIYNRETGALTRLPIGRRFEYRDLTAPSISQDGRYLAITLRPADKISADLGINNLTDGYVYDREAAVFEAINLAPDGSIGNDASFMPRLSADGRYVAFVSRASNLVPGDEGGWVDVFVRDRITGSTWRVSETAAGVGGNADSGTREILGPLGWGEQLAISDDGRYIAYISEADNLHLGPPLNCPYPGDTICGSILLYDRERGSTELIDEGRGRESFFHDLEISGDGSLVVFAERFSSCTYNNLCAELWIYDRVNKNLSNPTRGGILGARYGAWSLLTLPYTSGVNDLVFSPDNELVATAHSDGSAQIWARASGANLQRLEAHNLPVTSVIFSADGQHLFTASHDGHVYLWRVADGGLLGALLEDRGPIFGLARAPDGSMIAAAGRSRTWIWRFDGDKWRLLRAQNYQEAAINDLAFSPDGKLLALAVSDGTFWIRRVQDGETLARLGAPQAGTLAVQFAPQGGYLAGGGQDELLKLWHVDLDGAGELNITYPLSIDHPDWVIDLAFHPDGTLLATVCLDREVNLWRLPAGTLIEPAVRISHDEIISVAISPDGRSLAAGTAAGTTHLWDLDKILGSAP
jgi:WD40 repeat protein